ncbi:PepSY domain-containing protein, partial [Xanthomonas sp. AmX2]|uniref:PepSY domain-containing protein n=1 Tax=Xanthomonas sp. TaxID=29446 RepID=UPI001980422D
SPAPTVSAGAAASSPLTESQVRAQLSAQGYTKLDRLQFEDGLWKTEATSADGQRRDVRVSPVGGRIYAEGEASKLSEAEVRAALTARGYSKVHDLKYDDGLWEAKAQTSTGQTIEVHADPTDGTVVSAEHD